MTWKTLPPPRLDGSLIAQAPITVSAGRTKNGQSAQSARRRLYVTLRPHLLPPAAQWAESSAQVTVQLGEGDHAGLLRVARGGDHRVGQSGGKFKMPVLSVMTDDLAVPSVCPQTVVKFTADADAIIITLPQWAGGAGIEQPAPLAAAPKLATPAAPPPARDSEEPEEATFAEIKAWAERRGVHYNGTNIGVVNKVRRQGGWPNYIQVAKKVRAA